MPVLKNPKHERFAQARAAGMTEDAAFVEAGYSRNRGNATRLNAKESIRARIAEIQGKAAASVEMTLEEALKFCADVIRTPVGKVDQHHPLAQEVQIDDRGAKIKIPSKLDALATLAKFKGWFAPEKRESTLKLPDAIEEAMRRRFKR